MFETIKRLYAKTGNKTLVEKAVKKGWITEEQGKEIVGE
jgi:polyhydroxyalkanoate synthesis regulator phasin